MDYLYGTFIESQELICFTGDFFPFTSPHCELYLADDAINTHVHNANEYQIDDSALEFIINQGSAEESSTELNVFSTGEPLAISDQLAEAMTGP